MDLPYDYTPMVTTLGLILGGFGLALGAVLSAALLIRAITWGVPKLVYFFNKIAADRSDAKFLRNLDY